jgi:hypothetical protein
MAWPVGVSLQAPALSFDNLPFRLGFTVLIRAGTSLGELGDLSLDAPRLPQPRGNFYANGTIEPHSPLLSSSTDPDSRWALGWLVAVCHDMHGSTGEKPPCGPDRAWLLLVLPLQLR